jgi:signal transduction histidine kinase
MKKFSYLFLCAAVIAPLLAVVASVVLINVGGGDASGRIYRVQARRLAQEWQFTGSYNLADYPNITAVKPATETAIAAENSDYLIRQVNGAYYIFCYTDDGDKTVLHACLWMMNIMILVMFLLVIGLLLFLRNNILKPFDRLKNLPYALAKGNLTLPGLSEKNKYFGSFMWGMDLLREHLEQKRIDDLRAQKESKTLVMSISHDIKTPLSAIKLYAEALITHLYTEEDKRTNALIGIKNKADEIERLVSRIIGAASDRLNTQPLNITEFYLSEVLDDIRQYYADKLKLLHIGFTVEHYDNLLIKGDKDRATEVLQNMMENAVKYGDGGSIVISARSEEDCCLIGVENTGCTLSKDQLPHIFDLFWRGSNAAGIAGNGLGLYICRQILHGMDGEIFAGISGDEDTQSLTVTAVFKKC